MKKGLLKFAYLLVASFCFTNFLFTDHLGINLPLTEVIILAGLVIFNRVNLHRTSLYYLFAWLLSGLAVVFIHTNLAIWMNILFFLICCSQLLWSEIKHPLFSLWMWFLNLYRAQQHQWVRFAQYRGQKGRGARFLKTLPLMAIILAIVVVFILLYNYSSSDFQNSMSWLGEGLNNFFTFLVGDLTFWKLQFFVLGFTLIAGLMLRTTSLRGLVRVNKQPSQLMRVRRTRSSENLTLGLKKERNFGIILLGLLNLVIFLLNILDIKNIWINFTWDGGVLKQFVHEGTYMLILSIFISAVIALVLFRRNQNFYNNNKWLRDLTYIWLLQNALLTMSVGMRNYWYIKYFNLAYLRIGVIIFLILVLVGLLLVAYKVWKRQTGISVFGKGLHISLFILLCCSFVNWDKVIVNHNLEHADTAFFHRDFMVTLPDNTLATLKANEALFDVPDSTDSVNCYTREYFGWSETERTYSEWLRIRYTTFTRDWESRNWRTWNYPEAEAYQELKLME